MRVKVWIAWGMLVLSGAMGSIAAQEPGLGWGGEWGAFREVSAGAVGEFQNYVGAGLSVSGCAEQRCDLAIVQRDAQSHGEAKGYLAVESATAAVAHLESMGKEKCSLRLAKTADEKPVITVTADQGDCSYFSTPGGRFLRSYGLRSKTNFFTEDLPVCYASTEPAQVAICGNATLAAKEAQWTSLVWEVADLGDPALKANVEKRKILDRCNASSRPEDCMMEAFEQSVRQLHTRKTMWESAMTEKGDPEEATKKIAAVHGHYAHTFANGDVQGDKFKSTDTLDLSDGGDGTIRYDVQLYFYNGHECSRKGVAIYRRSGVFVDIEPANPLMNPVAKTTPMACYFEVVATADGVSLMDPTGACRESDCGARGGYVGAKFTFQERGPKKLAVKQKAK